MKRDSFIFYRSFMEALDELDDKQYAKVFRAICKFALEEKEPKLTGVEKAIFQLIKPQLIANQKRYENGCKGGRKPSENKPNDNQSENQNETEIKPNSNHLQTNVQPNDNDNVNDNENVNVNVNEKDNLKINNKKETNKQNVCAIDGEVFDGVIKELEKEIAPITVETFFRPIKCDGYVGNKLILSAVGLMKQSAEKHRAKLTNAISKASNGRFVDYEWA